MEKYLDQQVAVQQHEALFHVSWNSNVAVS